MNDKIRLLLTIGITTKNRPDDLSKTLHRIESSELHSCPIIIIDDGSDSPVIDPLDYKLDITFIRYTESAGLIPRRNELARLCKTKYLMSLDDDSSPVSGSIEDVLAVFETQPHVKTIALHVISPSHDITSISKTDYISRYFIGCGHIHEVETFNKLGGYSEHLVYGYEEVEYSLKLESQDYRILHKSDYVVIHYRSLVSRPGHYNSQCINNWGWVNGTYLSNIANVIEFYSFIKLHGIRSIPVVVPLYMDGIKSVSSRMRLHIKHYIRWKLKKTPSLA